MYLYPFYIYMTSEVTKEEEPKVIQDLDEVWPAQKKRGKNRYLFWNNRPNS